MIKKLAKSIRQYKKYAILAPLTITFEVVMEVIIPALMALLIDNGIDKGDMDYTLKIGIVLAVCCVISLFFGATAGRFAGIASTGFAANLRKDMFTKIQGFSFGNVDKFSSASLVTRMTTDVTRVQDAFQMIIRITVRSPAMLVFSLVMAFSVNPRLSLIFLGAIPVLGTGLFFIIRKAHPIFERMFKKYDRLNRVVQENLRGIRVVKSFVREDFETKKFTDVSGEIYDDSTKAERVLAFNSPLMQMTVYACMLLISWFGARLIIGSGGTQMSTGELTSLLTYTMQILMSLMMLSMIFVMLTMARASAERICEVLDEESTITNPPSPVTEVKNGEVVFSNVCFGYSQGKDKYCLKNASVTVPSGSTVGIIGGTGSSKSTLVQLIPRLYDVCEGSVSVGGVDVREYDLNTLRDSVAMVLQKNVLFSGTIKQNLRWGNQNATDEEMVAACKAACAHDFVSSFPDGYDTYIEQGGSNVSGGQKQRLCIARALLKNPKILILDDSTSAVDMETDAKLRAALAEIIPDTTKFIIAQRISSVQECDMIMVMDDGVITAVGKHDELLKTSPIYKEVFDSQTKGEEDR